MCSYIIYVFLSCLSIYVSKKTNFIIACFYKLLFIRLFNYTTFSVIFFIDLLIGRLLFYELYIPLFSLLKIWWSKTDLKSIFENFLKREKLTFSLYLWDFTSYLPWHCLYFLPLPHGVETAIFLHFLQFFYRNYK